MPEAKEVPKIIDFSLPPLPQYKVEFVVTVPRNYSLADVRTMLAKKIMPSLISHDLVHASRVDPPHAGTLLIRELTKRSMDVQPQRLAVDRFIRSMGRRYGLGDTRLLMMVDFANDADGANDAAVAERLPGISAKNLKIVRALLSEITGKQPIRY